MWSIIYIVMIFVCYIVMKISPIFDEGKENTWCMVFERLFYSFIWPWVLFIFLITLIINNYHKIPKPPKWL